MARYDSNTKVLSLDAHDLLCLDWLRDSVNEVIEAFNRTTHSDWMNEDGMVRNQEVCRQITRLRTQSILFERMLPARKETNDE